MLTHIVLFRLKEEAKGQASQLVERLLGMKGKIPQLLDIEAGVDVVHSGRSYDVALITRFASLADMQAYQVHPVHQEVLQFVREVTSESVSVDFLNPPS
jgi:hypothetical protein